MPMYGYAGKILRLDLTRRTATAIDTEKYRRWGGGHGMGSALFWDFCKDKTITDGRHPANVCCVMTSPSTERLFRRQEDDARSLGWVWGCILSPGSRAQGFGGRFSTMLKYAGWDGIVIEGKAEKPVWVDIRNDQVTFRDASGLWGKDTWATQQEIWKQIGIRAETKTSVAGPSGTWIADKEQRTGKSEGRTTQKPAMLTHWSGRGEPDLPCLPDP